MMRILCVDFYILTRTDFNYFNFSYCILHFIIYVLVAVCRPQLNKYYYYYVATYFIAAFLFSLHMKPHSWEETNAELQCRPCQRGRRYECRGRRMELAHCSTRRHRHGVVGEISRAACVNILQPSSTLSSSQPSTTCSISLLAQHLRPSGLFSCPPHSLELSPRFHLGPDHHCGLFQTFA